MRDFKIYLSIASLLLVIYLVAQYNKPASINWEPSMYYNDKVPFGTYILYRQLPTLFPGAKVINTNQTLEDQFHDKNISNSNYFIFAKTVDLNKHDFEEMVNYIKAGNSVFISAFEWQGVLADTLDLQIGSEYKKKSVGLNFTNPGLKRANSYKFDRYISIQYFSSFDTSHATVLGKNDLGNSSLLRFTYGKGSLYLCANPGLFTNFGLLNSNGADYVAKALSYLPPQPNIYWDELQNGDIQQDLSPMRVLFSNASLQWAYYISLFSLLIFVLYEVKRRQRIIPVIEPLQNSTVDFVNVVGQVYYEQRNNLNIAQKKTLYFLEHLRTQYYLKTTLLDTDFTDRFAQKTGIDPAFAREIINHIKYVNVQNRVTDDELIYLNHLIEQFYIQSR
jgi:hypothetical protein